MLKLPRRRPTYSSYRSPYYRKPKQYQKIPAWWLGLSIPVLILLLELGARMYLGITSPNGDLKGNSPLDDAYRLKFVTQNEKAIQGIPQDGDLQVKRSSSVGYELVENQKNQFIGINPQGFRDSQSLGLVKPKNEIRVFVLGNSTVFGQGLAKNEETISHHLEKLLQQRISSQVNSPEKFRPDVFPFFKPDRAKLLPLPAKIHPGEYRVINGGVPGYTMGNDLSQLALKVLPYQPDVIIVLGGYTDLLLSSQQEQADIPHIDGFLANAQEHFKSAFNLSLFHWFDNTYIVKTFNYLAFKPQPSLAQQTLPMTVINGSLSQSLPKDDAELKRRIERYKQQQKALVQLGARLNIPVVIAFQPEITGRRVEQLSPQEKALQQQLEKDYLQRMPKAYKKLIQEGSAIAKNYPNQVKVKNLYGPGPSLPKNSFTGTIHLSDKANQAIALELYNTLTNWEKMQIIPENFHLKD